MADTGDGSALRLMLAYVEAECLRMGAKEAAQHAALAAALVPGGEHIAVTMPAKDEPPRLN